jgi:deoxyribonuclease-4
MREIDAKPIGEAAKRLDIKLSIHAPYWINLNSTDKKKIQESAERILKCCEIGHILGAYAVVFHAGFYGKMEKEETYQNIKRQIEKMQSEIKKKGWKVKLAPETMGKINVFGDASEILRLMRETGCFCCVDFAHLFARYQGKLTYKEIYEKFRHLPSLHCHFSGIIYGEKGERSHKITPDSELRKLLEVLPKNKEIVIINESPEPVDDSVKSIKIWKRL